MLVFVVLLPVASISGFSKGISSYNRTNLNPEQRHEQLEIFLYTTYFQYNSGFYRQKHGCAKGSPVSPHCGIPFGKYVPRLFQGNSAKSLVEICGRWMSEIKTQEMQVCTVQINSVDSNVKFTPENVSNDSLKPVHPKGRTPHTQASNLLYLVQYRKESTDLYTGETEQPLNKRMAQHRRANSTGQDSMSKRNHPTTEEEEVYETTYPPRKLPRNILSSPPSRFNKHSHLVPGNSKNDGHRHLASGSSNDCNDSPYNSPEH